MSVSARTGLSVAVRLGALIFVGMAVPSGHARAQEPERSAEEIARELSNPNSPLASLSFPLDLTFFGGDAEGASGQKGFTINFQPVFPYPLGNGTNFFLRPNIPIVISRPVPAQGGGFESRGVALGDIGIDAAIGKTLPGGMMIVGGVVASLPWATDDALSLDQYLLGPELLVARASSSLVLGVLLTQSWNVGGNDAFDTSITAGQYFYTVILKNGWTFGGQPNFSYNHKAEKGQRFTLPLGGGFTKTILAGTMPWKFGLQYYYYVASPDGFGPTHQLKGLVTAVVPLPW